MSKMTGSVIRSQTANASVVLNAASQASPKFWITLASPANKKVMSDEYNSQLRTERYAYWLLQWSHCPLRSSSGSPNTSLRREQNRDNLQTKSNDRWDVEPSPRCLHSDLPSPASNHRYLWTLVRKIEFRFWLETAKEWLRSTYCIEIGRCGSFSFHELVTSCTMSSIHFRSAGVSETNRSTRGSINSKVLVSI